MFTFDVTKWVPGFLLRDKNGYAIAKAIQSAMQTMNDIIAQGVACVTDYDAMPEWRLDELAWEYMIDWYDYQYDIEAKRRTIRGSHEVYKRLGTLYAVQNAIKAVFPNSIIREWWDYGGDPYTFKLWIDTGDDGVNADNIEKVISRAQYYKNARSVLGGVEYIISPSKSVESHTAAAVSGVYISVGVTI